MDAAFDARLARRFAPVDLRGRFELQLQKLWLAGALLQRAQGRALWRQAAWVGPGGQRELGDYVALLETPQAGDVRAELETLSGPVTVAGSATLRDRQYSVDARIDARGGFDADLAQALSLVAAPGENGYLLRLDGVLAGAR